MAGDPAGARARAGGTHRRPRRRAGRPPEVPALNPAEDWQGRWREGRIGWHEPQGSAALKRFWPSLSAGPRVLVPLCGKARDLKWLADRGHTVVGVELSRLAIEAFFDEHGLGYTQERAGPLVSYRTDEGDITLYGGDYFDFRDAPCDALFDRGALVAMPAGERPRYVAHTKSLLRPGAARLLVTLEYDQQRAAGPPFSVAAAELGRYWPDLELVERRNDIGNAPPKFRGAGLTEFYESVWRSPLSASVSPPCGP